MKNIDFKKFLPYLAALVVFVALTLSYFSPITKGYELRQADVINYKGMAKEIHDYRKTYGDEPLWTNSMFGGMPAYQIDVYNNTNLLHEVDRALQLWFPGVVGYFLLLFLGFYILMLCMKVDPWLAIIGAVAYAFSSYFIIIVEAGHNTKVHALAYAPAVLGGFIMLLRGNMWLGAAIFTLFFGLELQSNHVQITYYLFILLLIVGIGELVNTIVEKKNLMQFFTRSGFLVIGAALGIMASSSNLWNTYEYGKDTTRGPSELTISGDGIISQADQGLDKAYITDWSYGIAESWSFVFPSANGPSSGFIGNEEAFAKTKAISSGNKGLIRSLAEQGAPINSYWGNQPFTSGPTYMGALVVFLFVLSFVFVKDKLKWAILAASVLALFLGWGRNFMGFTEFFIDHFPGYNKFRSVSMIITMIELTMPFMAILFIKELIEDKDRFVREKKKFLIAAGSVFGVLLLVVAVPSSFISFLSENDMRLFGSPMAMQLGDLQEELVAYRMELFRGDAFRSLGIILLGFALIYFYIYNNLPKSVMLIGIGVIITADLYSFDRRYLNDEKQGSEYISWQKAGEYPYMPSNGDISILNQEVTNNPELMKKIQTEMQSVQAEKGKDLQVAQMIEGAFPALNFNSNYRVLGVGDPFNSSAISYFHKSVGGYHGAKLKRYQELIEFGIRREHNMCYGLLNQMLKNNVPVEQLSTIFPSTGIFERTHLLNMLNAKYIVLNPGIPAAVNPKAKGPAWFASNVRFVNDANEEVMAVSNVVPAETLQVVHEGKQVDSVAFKITNFAIEDSVIADVRFKDKVKFSNVVPDSNATVQLESYLPNHLVYKTKNSQDGFVVFSEIYYNKGWKATIDGQPADYVRVNYILRGMDVPKGDHVIEFTFEPDNFKSMKKINLAGNLMLLIAVALFGYMEFRRSRKTAA